MVICYCSPRKLIHRQTRDSKPLRQFYNVAEEQSINNDSEWMEVTKQLSTVSWLPKSLIEIKLKLMEKVLSSQGGVVALKQRESQLLDTNHLSNRQEYLWDEIVVEGSKRFPVTVNSQERINWWQKSRKEASFSIQVTSKYCQLSLSGINDSFLFSKGKKVCPF